MRPADISAHMFVDCHQGETLGVPIVQITDKFSYKSGVCFRGNRPRVETCMVQQCGKFFAAQGLRIVERRLVRA